ncbi:hypothetical protein K2X33_08625 [bacterium]|nr:hypothetical protein [bacterium]
MTRLIAFALLVSPWNLRAASTGADALLDSVGGAPVQTTQSTSVVSSELSDPFLVQFFSHVQVERDLPYEIRLWAQKLLKKDYAGAAHLWTAIQKHLPGKFEAAARTGYLYALWNLKVPQTFLDQWVDSLSRKSFQDSPLSLALDQTIQPGFDAWLFENAPVITPEQAKTLASISLARGNHFASLRAWGALRAGEAASPVLEILPADHPLKVPLANTVALALARKGDLRTAGAVLKQHLEPAIDSRKDVDGLSKHYLQVARLLYQAGSLDGAAEFYQRVPDGAPDFLKAREELAWVWLRQGNTAKTRGELKTLRGDLFKDRFAPDVYVVRAISNLKLCYYGEVEKELNAFVQSNQEWAKKIEEALKSEDPKDFEEDFFSKAAKRSVASREAEAQLLEALATQSITATLPAVGPQQHWEQARVRSLVALEAAKKHASEEVRRHWKDRKTILAEAIRKMQFVKVELFSQVRTLAKQEPSAASTNASVSALEKDTAGRLKDLARKDLQKASEGDLVFPFDGVIWPDELFHLTSVAQSRCQEKGK